MGEDARANVESAVRRVRDGDVDAFAIVVRHHQAMVWRIVLGTLVASEDADSVVQDVFVVAYRRLDTYVAGSDFAAWLRGIARNVLLKAMRSRRTARHHLERYREESLRRLDMPQDSGHGGERLVALRECRSRLGEDARSALSLRYEKGLDFSSIASALGRTVAGARQLLTRVRVLLRECVRDRLKEAHS